jgi:pyrroline-5-carboxylate reductase
MNIAIVGCGVMGSAFARQLSKQGHKLLICGRNCESLKQLGKETGAQVFESPADAVKDAQLVVVAIKPYGLDELIESFKPQKGQVVVSILAGVTCETLKGLFAPATVVRAMPNLALNVGEAVVAVVEDPSLSTEQKQTLKELFHPFGTVLWTSEAKINAITALAGSGPAFVIAILEAMVDGGIAMGLKADEALKLTLQTVKGAVALLEAEEGHPGNVRWKISAPKGTTIEGICAFEQAGVRTGIIQTLKAAYQKAEDMG